MTTIKREKYMFDIQGAFPKNGIPTFRVQKCKKVVLFLTQNYHQDGCEMVGYVNWSM